VYPGQIFTMNAGTVTTYTSSNQAGNIPFNSAAVAAPIGTANDLYFVNAGVDTFDKSQVWLFNSSTGGKTPLRRNIPRASGEGMAIRNGQLVVGNGFGNDSSDTGQLRSFPVATLASVTNLPVNWNTGAVIINDSKNSAAGMFVDQHGFLFVGGEVSG